VALGCGGRALSDLLRVLITLDSIIVQNPYLLPAWSHYKRMMEYVRAEPGRYGVDEKRVRDFEELLVTLDQAILSGTIFLGCIEQVRALGGDWGVGGGRWC
jgi:WASH complex subunit 7